MPDCLEGACPECLGWPKKCKNGRMWPNNTILCTDTDLKSKNVRVKKVYVLSKYIDSKRKFEIKAKKKSAWKRLFLGHPNSGSCVQNLDSFTKYFSVYKILVPWKNQPLPITTSRDNLGCHNAPPPVLFVCKISPSFVG